MCAWRGQPDGVGWAHTMLPPQHRPALVLAQPSGVLGFCLGLYVLNHCFQANQVYSLEVSTTGPCDNERACRADWAHMRSADRHARAHRRDTRCCRPPLHPGRT